MARHGVERCSPSWSDSRCCSGSVAVGTGRLVRATDSRLGDWRPRGNKAVIAAPPQEVRSRPKAAIFWGWQSHKRGNAVLIFRRAAAAVVRNLRWAGAGPAQRRRRRQPLAAKQPWCAAVGREGWRSASMVAPCDGGRRPLADIASRARRARSSLLGDRVRMVAVDGTMAVTDQPSRANPRPESGSSQDDVSRPTPQSRGRRAPWRALRSPV